MLPLTLPLGFSSESLPTPTRSAGPVAVSPTYQHCHYHAPLDCSRKVLRPDIPMAFHQVLPSNITLSESFPPPPPAYFITPSTIMNGVCGLFVICSPHPNSNVSLTREAPGLTYSLSTSKDLELQYTG